MWRLILFAVIASTGCSQTRRQAAPKPEQYTITEHVVISETASMQQRDEYTLTYGTEVLKVRYEESQTSSAKPGDFPGTGLHLHSYYSSPDLSQIPPAGTIIWPCLMNPERDKDGDLVIAKQPTPEPCMARIGGVLRYEPAPNGPVLFTYVSFEILSEKAQ